MIKRVQELRSLLNRPFADLEHWITEAKRQEINTKKLEGLAYLVKLGKCVHGKAQCFECQGE